MRSQDDDILVAQIPSQEGQTAIAAYTIPAGFTGYLREIAVTVATGSTKAGNVTMFQRRNADDVASPFTGRRHVWEAREQNGAIVELFDYSVVFPEKTDIWFAGEGVGSVVAIDADFELLLVPNRALPPIP
jgi:hypothetical protein